MAPDDLIRDLPLYRDFRPTGCDSAGLGLDGDDNDRQAWRVLPVGQNRDSDCLTRSNFRVAVAALGTADPDGTGHEVHRFGHWATGWFEIILIRPDDGPAAECAAGIVSALADYAVLSDDDYSTLEYENAATAWGNMSTRERFRVCARYRVSIFAARRDDVPECDSGEIVSYLAE